MRIRAAGRALALARRAAPAHVLWYVLLTALAGLGPLTVAWLTKLVIDAVASDGARWNDLVNLAVALAGAGLVVALLPHITRYLRAELDRKVMLGANEDLYAAVDRFVGLRRFEDPAFLDRLQIARSSGVNGPGMLVDGTLGCGRALIVVGGFAGTLLSLGPWIAFAVLLSAVPAFFAELALSRRRVAMVAAIGQSERKEMFYAGLLTDPQAAKELRLFGAGPFLWSRMAVELRAINRGHRDIDRREMVTQTGLAAFAALTTGALLLWAVRAATLGTLTVGDVALVVAAVAAVQNALAGLVSEAVSVHQAVLLFDHYLAVVDAAPDLPVRARPAPTPPLRDGITFDDVWFRYADDQPWVLRGVDLFLPVGAATAVVGLNGAGKTTLVKLLCRLYDPSRGRILWDGVDLRDLDPGELRQRIRAVFQDAVRYDLTARENIALGDLTALDEPARVVAAARAAGVHDLLDGLPDGYETPLTRVFFSEADRNDPSTGTVLSGGQWQRLALARGLVAVHPDLLILDEPSSALDAQAEYEVHSRLRELRAGRTSLLVSHRLGVLREADQIVVLADGRVTEQGRHDELILVGGEYARLFTLQASGYQQRIEESV